MQGLERRTSIYQVILYVQRLKGLKTACRALKQKGEGEGNVCRGMSKMRFYAEG